MLLRLQNRMHVAKITFKAEKRMTSKNDDPPETLRNTAVQISATPEGRPSLVFLTDLF